MKGDSKVGMEALSISKICNRLGTVQMDFLKSSHLQGLTLAVWYPRRSVQVDVLIGADHCYSFVTGQVNRQSKHTASMLKVVENSGVNGTSKRFWELESVGIAETENPVILQEKERAVADFNTGLNFDGRNYEVRLPWKRDPPRLGSNCAQALRRLESAERKLRQDPVIVRVRNSFFFF